MEDLDITHLSDMDEEDFQAKPSTKVTKPSSPAEAYNPRDPAGAHSSNMDMDDEDFQAKPSTKVTKSSSPAESYNPRDPAGAHSSNFADAFGALKKSEFYKEAEVVKPSTNEPKPAVVTGRPVAPGTLKVGRSGSILVRPCQRKNPVLRSISSVPWEFEDDLIPDFVVGNSTCVVFLSLRYHSLNPDYIHSRLKLLGNKYRLRILLLQVDMADPSHMVKQVNRLCLLAGLTLMLAGSAEDAGKILETYKMFEAKPPDLIMERQEEGLHAKVANALTSLRCVNKTDAATLLRTFGSMARIIQATEAELELVPGFGCHKAKTLYRTLHQPFLRQT